jgi:hypothetical protein
LAVWAVFDGKHDDRRTIDGLLQALRRIRGEAESLAHEAQIAIEHHSFDPYRLFRSKVEEHQALASVIRARDPGGIDKARVDGLLLEEERLRNEMLVRSSLRFFYALSATPILPIGARETFIDELENLTVMRERLAAPEHKDKLSEGVIDDLDTARMILEEIAEKAPQLLDFGRARAAA